MHFSRTFLASLLVVSCLPIAASAQAPSGTCAAALSGKGPVKVKLTTSSGPIVLQLEKEKAPISTENFAKYVDSGHYNGTVFHRVIDGFMIQGGDPLGQGTGGPGYKFADEFSPKRRHGKAGVLSMANSGPNTNGGQFFITLAATPWLDDKHSVFGEVVEGMDVVKKIGTTATSKPGDRPLKPITVESVTIEKK
jgi:peptidyl-prolyl cis-trans isomerase A (cyclophilin A)